MISESRREPLGFYTASDSDLKVLTRQKRQILNLLHNRWLTGKQLQEITGASEATRRVRELRNDDKYEILKRGEGREWYYSWTGRKQPNFY